MTAKPLQTPVDVPRRAARVTIGNDVWTGHGVIVLPGVAVVTRDVPR